ncbi:GGDEF domain-containing protein [Vreelandella populi]|uniref:diguanylate cyclase n=1 Tax=Vreelandella populi TaxID=2498858 RepID=A0A3S0WJ55_9GAMM|nr:GGDEF domain-containing protein [Halomonas populi]RUR42359.1 GGDEF domain-containing protein [Halomonas populi]RUR46035.1 GGDEF domain-containing protein [Halomonas populi]
MAFDPATMLTLTIAIAAAAAVYLLLEWRSARDGSLLCWSAGFATITVGSSLSLLRVDGYFFVGVWLANGLLIFAHWMFLFGVIRFVGGRPSRSWALLPAAWSLLLLLPDGPESSKFYLIVNSLLVGFISLRASALLRLAPDTATVGTRQLHYVLLVHGVFYIAKATVTLLPGTLIDLTVFRGTIIRVSLVEGVMAIMLIALSMTGTVRYRRESMIKRLAERDPLTSLYNRRGFEARTRRNLANVSAAHPGALLLIDIDHFKLANDLHGHAAGDFLLVTLSDLTRQILPEEALKARLGGDEFAFLLSDTSAQQIEHFGEELRVRFYETAAKTFNTPYPVTLSLGATLFNQPPKDLNALLEQSDRALYEAKRNGRDRLEVRMNG